MYSRSNTPENSSSPWLVRAEVTIRHGAEQSGYVPPSASTSSTVSTEGLRMVYKWSQDQNGSLPQNTQIIRNEIPAGSYAFQRGNILFTSTPPSRSSSSNRPSTMPRYSETRFTGNTTTPSSSQNLGINVSDSGYNSEQFSPQSYSSLPLKRPSQLYNRRCKSTCSIVLSAAGTPVCNDENDKSQRQTAANCQTQCTDSRCYHRAANNSGRFGRFINVVPEACEDCVEGVTTSRRKAFTTHFCTRVPGKINNTEKKNQQVNCRDAASQTNDIEMIQDEDKTAASLSTKTHSHKAYEARRRTAPGLLRRFGHVRENYEELPAKEDGASVSPVQSSSITETSNLPSSKEVGATDSSGKEDSSKRKSRTVHIDVYCTGSEEDNEDSSYSDSSESSSQEKRKQRTVFESDDVKVTHSRALENRLPRGFQDEKAFLQRASRNNCESFNQGPMRMPSLASSKGYETDDVMSSLYPSQFSSYSAIRDLDSAPWSAASSCAGITQDAYDSAAATSWKDTFSDIESLLNSRASLTPCDSFEYAQSSDRERNDKLEKSRGNESAEEKISKTWRSPQIERRQLLQHKKMKEFLDKHQVGWFSSPEESHHESDDSDEVGWSFVTNDDNSRGVRRDSTIRRASKEKSIIDETRLPASSKEPEDRGCLSDGAPHPSKSNLAGQIRPLGSKTSSPTREKVESRITSPSTMPEGEKTEHLFKASRFGAIVGASRKPGHHVGPTKNPSCSCEHCRRFFEEDGPRGRSRSLGAIERRPGPWIRRDKDRDIISQAPHNSKNDVS